MTYPTHGGAYIAQNDQVQPAPEPALEPAPAPVPEPHTAPADTVATDIDLPEED